jgi:hypothetical protein
MYEDGEFHTFIHAFGEIDITDRAKHFVCIRFERNLCNFHVNHPSPRWRKDYLGYVRKRRVAACTAEIRKGPDLSRPSRAKLIHLF